MINTRNIAAELRLAHWAQVMKARKDSGMSIAAYCKTEGFHQNIYFYWQRKLRGAAYEELTGNEAVTHTKSLVPSGWLQLAEVKPPEPSGELTIEINGCQINVSAGTDPTLLATVCGVLKAL